MDASTGDVELPLFEPDFYRAQVAHDLGAQDPYAHFLEVGDRLGLDPSPYFSTTYYKVTYPDWADRGTSALRDYLLRLEAGEERRTHPLIDPEDYRRRYPDVHAAHDPVTMHFARHGDGESRSPSDGFDADAYRQAYLSLEATEPFRHYVARGKALGYWPRPRPHDNQQLSRVLSAFLATPGRPVLVIGHDAQRAGAPLLLLSLSAQLKSQGFAPLFFLLKGGPLLADYEDLGPVLLGVQGWQLEPTLAALPVWVPTLANTVVTAPAAQQRAAQGGRTVLLVHEMLASARHLGFESAVRAAADSGARIVFGLPRVREQFLDSWGGQVRATTAVHTPPPPEVEALADAASRRPRSAARLQFIGGGVADSRKGFDRFLDIAAVTTQLRPDARFVWLGEVGAWGTELLGHPRYRGIQLTLPGFVTDSPRWYAGSAAYVLTSRHDPGPATAIQAIRAGAALVAYDDDVGIRGLADQLATWIAPDDVHGFAQALIRAADDTPRARRRRIRTIDRYTNTRRYLRGIIGELTAPD